jgi:hypothetical protein
LIKTILLAGINVGRALDSEASRTVFLFFSLQDKSWNRGVAINRFRSKWDAQLSLQVPQRKAEMHREHPNQPFLPGSKFTYSFFHNFTKVFCHTETVFI